jgi:hypothetical protein
MSVDPRHFELRLPCFVVPAKLSPHELRPLRSKRLGFPIPKGLCPPAQGCEARATLGKRVESIVNPNGVVTEWHFGEGGKIESRSGHDPFRVGGHFATLTFPGVRPSPGAAMSKSTTGFDYSMDTFVGGLRYPSMRTWSEPTNELFRRKSHTAGGLGLAAPGDGRTPGKSLVQQLQNELL